MNALFDISKVVPEVVLTNASTASTPANLDWWFDISTPSGAKIHQGSSTSPDVNNMAWTSKTFTTWPKPMGQIQWGGVYTLTIYVKDSVNNVFQQKKTVSINRPHGSAPDTPGNFGLAKVVTEMKCNEGQLYVEDTTPLIWNGITPSSPINQKFTLVFPYDATGTQPSPHEIIDASVGLIPIAYSGDTYQLARSVTATYPTGQGMSVRIKYKSIQNLQIACDSDLCQFMCGYRKLLTSIQEGNCGGDNLGILTRVNALMTMALLAKMQPGCGVKVSDLIKELKSIEGLDCGCGDRPATIGINGTPGSTTPNPPQPAPVYIPLAIKGTVNSPTECPGNPFPKEVWTPDSVTSLGVAKDVNELIAKLMGDASLNGWGSLGTWSIGSYCDVVLNPENGVNTNTLRVPVSDTPVGPGACVDGFKTYLQPITSFPGGSTVQPKYPLTAYIRFTPSGQQYSITAVASYEDLLDQLNGLTNKPATLQFGPAPKGDKTKILIDDSACNTDIYDLSIRADISDGNIAFGAANNGQDRATSANSGSGITSGTVGIDVNAMQELGFVSGTKSEMCDWHIIRDANMVYSTVSNTGRLNVTDMTNPLYPVNSFLSLPTPSGAAYAPFSSGLYNGNTYTRAFYDLYFPTDQERPTDAGDAILLESSSGCVWRYDPSTNTAIGLYGAPLIGRCPRVLLGNVLWLSMDGNRENELGRSSGSARNLLMGMQLSSLTTGSSSLTYVTPSNVTAAVGASEIWSISYEPLLAELWLTLQNGTLIRYNPSTTSLQSYPSIWNVVGGFSGLVNTTIVKLTTTSSRLYCSASGGQGTRFVDINTTTGQPSALQVFAPFNNRAGVVITGHYNVHVPDGAGYCLVTADNGNTSSTRGILAKFTLDGTFLSLLEMQRAGNMYNVVTFQNAGLATMPNGLTS